MNSWNELFLDEKNRAKIPASEVHKFVLVLEKLFSARPLNLWDLCCGAGRHTILLAKLGHRIYASDIAPNAVELTGKWLEEENLEATLAVEDMTICPWPEVKFHGIVCWGSLPHNTLAHIRKTIDMMYEQLVPGGMFVGTMRSLKADTYGHGKEIEPHTFIPDEGKEKGIIHHFSDESEVRELFRKWELVSLVEQVMTYAEKGENFMEYNPFPFTNWGILAKKL
jgi:cyclopropane fatty-acyl-phospholipid synthase-like methyltransferase